MKYNFNEGWICYKTGDREHAFKVTLPHDAMQLDARSETSAGGTIPAGMRRRIIHTRKHLCCHKMQKSRK